MTDDSRDPTKELPVYAKSRGKSLEPVSGPYAVERPNRFGRRVFWTLLVVAALVVGALGINMTGWLPEFRNPFAEQKTDASQPPLLISIKDLSRFTAAEGEFQVVIDLKKDRKYVPDWLVNERTLYVADGKVQAYVDFSNLGESAVKVSPDRKSVEITLPAPQLDDPALNNERSYVFAEERGLINRIGDFFDGDPNRQRETLLTAESKIKEAAANSTLLNTAEENTRKMLIALLHSLGYDAVTVTFSNA
ncbi:hypothetical protein F4553_003999 [Allocatelliglobosispora scoriae]|uniref:DUF4230 domain-containing protein n=1 Tax=Allocatelliglobosispora scoriae TaxID=643052 RepID=A0A841BV31_9ACTN|nr:DUF4230 domain-containing protein [Allocatelliglobosispora scoriae]MBB5870620.1 hypothetical protein [Allocatelliglobosispora scoriae]